MHFKYLMAAGLQKNMSLRQIIFAKPHAEDLKERAKKLLREAYVDSGLIAFDASPLWQLTSGEGLLWKIRRPCEEGVGLSMQSS